MMARPRSLRYVEQLLNWVKLAQRSLVRIRFENLSEPLMTAPCFGLRCPFHGITNTMNPRNEQRVVGLRTAPGFPGRGSRAVMVWLGLWRQGGRGQSMAWAQLSAIARQTKKAQVCLLILSVFLAMTASAARAETLVLAAPDARPTTFLADGEPAGILVDVVTEVFRRTGRSVDIKIMPWARCLSEARTGTVDGVFPIYRVPEREQFLTYSNEVLLPQLVVFFSRQDATTAFSGELSELRDVNIGIVRYTSYGKKFDQAVKDGTLHNIDLAHNIEANLDKLMHGRVALIANYRYGVLEAAEHLGLLAEIKEISPPIESVPSYLAFTKQRDFAKPLDDFQTALASMKQDGTYDRIIGRYPH